MMKRIFIIVLMLYFGQFAFAQHEGHNTPTEQKEQPVTYTCPMHPEIHALKPGNCPKCGMKLVKEKPKAAPREHNKMQVPTKDTSKKMDNLEEMSGMQMGDNNPNMENIDRKRTRLNSSH